MTRDALDVVLLLRRRAVDEVRRVLADTIAAAHAAHEHATAAERAIENEADKAADPSGDDLMVEAFAAWLPGARHRAAQARAQHVRLDAEITRRRAELQASRTALEAIEALMVRRMARRDVAEARRGQRAMDEAAARTHATPAPAKASPRQRQ